jgi:hypothetical protein
MAERNAPQPLDAPFEPTLALEDQPFVQLVATAERDLYEEYVLGLDDLPVLRDAVALPPPPPPDFRHGERPDLRKERRDDAHAARERRATEREQAYIEYLAVESTGSQPPLAPKLRRAKPTARAAKAKHAKPRTRKPAKRRK